MKKYRVRLDSGRVIGPFFASDLPEVYKKANLSGQEDFQEFPIGDWLPLAAHPELASKQSLLEESRREDTLLAKLDDLEDLSQTNIKAEEVLTTGEQNPKAEQVPIDKPQEFKFTKEDPFSNRPAEANSEEEKEEPAPKATQSEKSESMYEMEQAPEGMYEEENDSDVEQEGADLDRTVVRGAAPATDVDKTVVNPEYVAYLKEQEELRAQELAEKAAEEEAEEAEEEEELDYENEKTQFFSAKDLKPNLEVAAEVEEEIILKEKEVKKQIEASRVIKKPKIEKKKNNLIYILIGVALLGYFLLEPEEEKKVGLVPIKVVYPDLYFPAKLDVQDKVKADQFLAKALELDKEEKFVSKLKSIKFLYQSLLNKFDGNVAAYKLIFLASEVIHSSDEYFKDIRDMYNFVLYHEDKLLSNKFYAAAGAYFYFIAGKLNAAHKIIEKYSLIDGNKKTPELFAVYLRILTEKGDFVEAQKIAKSLESLKDRSKDFFIIKALYNYYKAVDDSENSLKYLELGLKKYPNSVYFLLIKGEIFIKSGDLKESKRIIYKVNALQAEQSKIYYADYLKLKGLYLARLKKYDQALKDLKKSVELNPESDLVVELADGQRTENEEINKLFDDSKAATLIKRSQKQLEKDELQEAFKLALQAVNVAPENVEARLNLNKIQLAKGYYDDALKEIEDLFNKNRANPELQYSLVETYIKMFKFRKAFVLLDLIEDKQTSRYSLLKSMLYEREGDMNLALSWLKKSIEQNKLNEKSVYRLAKSYIKYHKYDLAKSTLNKAMKLDPDKLEYKISYAKILYEVESASSAIGYLYGVLEDYPDNIQILSEIGIYYYRSGQIKNFQNIKEKIQGLPGQSNLLNRFLLEAAKLDDDVQDIIKYSRKVVELNPGDLDTRLFLAQYLMELKKFKESKAQLDEIEKRFKSYPRLSYFNARFYMLVDDIDKAKELAELEMKNNPRVIDGPLLLADIYVKKKDLLKAKEFYLRASQLDQNNVDAILGLAFVAFSRNQYDMALDQYQKASDLAPSNAEIYRLLGDTYRKIGQGQIAIKNYKQYLELSPNSSYKSKIETYIRTME